MGRSFSNAPTERAAFFRVLHRFRPPMNDLQSFLHLCSPKVYAFLLFVDYLSSRTEPRRLLFRFVFSNFPFHPFQSLRLRQLTADKCSVGGLTFSFFRSSVNEFESNKRCFDSTFFIVFVFARSSFFSLSCLAGNSGFSNFGCHRRWQVLTFSEFLDPSDFFRVLQK